MSGGRPVARLVQPVIVRVAAMAALMAAIAVTGVVLSTSAVNYLTHDLQPAAAANRQVYQDLTDMSAATAAWSGSGTEAAADDYEQALLRLPADEQVVRGFAAGDNELELLVVRQERAAARWIEAYAQPVMDADPGTSPTAAQTKAGQAAFDQIRSAHQASTDASFRLKGTVLAVVLLALAAWYVIAQSRRKLLSELSEPLLALEQVVQRMAKGEHDVRAELKGPKEVRAVALALNEFADGTARARAVEGRIQNELRSLDTARDDFVSNVSHELRTPLTTISGYLELVADEFEDQLQPLIDDLLALAKAEARPTDMEPIDLAHQQSEVDGLHVGGACLGLGQRE